jgi:uncharacterized protein YjbJ (UPF0337 family)
LADSVWRTSERNTPCSLFGLIKRGYDSDYLGMRKVRKEKGNHMARRKKKRGSPQQMLDKTVGRVAEGAGSVTGDRSLQAEGRAMRTKGERRSYLVSPHPDGGWKVQTQGAKRASSVHRTKAEAVAAAKEKARSKAPSQVLVYKKDGLEVQEEKAYG